jgi:hypothetical protein
VPPAPIRGIDPALDESGVLDVINEADHRAGIDAEL